MTFMRVRLMVGRLRSRKAGLPAGHRRGRANFPAFPAAAFDGARRR